MDGRGGCPRAAARALERAAGARREHPRRHHPPGDRAHGHAATAGAVAPGVAGAAGGRAVGQAAEGAIDAGRDRAGAGVSRTHPERYKWIALSNTTIGILLATINSSIVLIALPDIFRGINLNPLTPENSSYLLWMIMGFLVATAVLVVGGILGPVDWRLVFLVSVPVGVFGTVWSWAKLEERGVRRPARIDWLGNITFAGGLIAILVAITYGIQPYGGHTMGWTNPRVIGAAAAGF